MEVTLLDNEVIRLSNESGDEWLPINDDQINEKYLKGEVRIITEQARYPLATIKGMIDSKKYNLNPEFQRRHRWTDGQKSRLIESFIMNVPIPPIFLYEVKYSNYEVMDGLQRLSTIYDFYDDKFVLKDLEYWKELEGRKYSTLPEEVRLGIDRRYLSSIILLKETAKSKEEEMRLKQIVFERINSGGTKLEYQESRNALYPGAFNDLCIRLARHEVFCRIFQIPQPDEEELAGGRPNPVLDDNDMYCKMRDVETVMRDRGVAHMGIGHGKGEDKVNDAVKAAIESPLLETTVAGAKAILLNITGGFDLGMNDINDAASQIQEVADKDVFTIFGAAVREDMQDEMSITIIATGFENEPSQYADVNKTMDRALDGGEELPGEETGQDDETEESPGQTIVDLDLEDDRKTLGDMATAREDSWRKTLDDLKNDTPSKSNFDIPSFLK